MHCSVFIVGLYLQVNIVRCIADVVIVGLYLQYMLLDALQCLLWVCAYSKCCQMHCNVFIVDYTYSICCQMHCSVFIVGLYLQYMLLDAMQCLYCGSIPIVYVIRCIAVSIVGLYLSVEYVVRCIAVSIVGLYLQYMLLDALQCLYCGTYTYSKCCQMHCSVFIVGLYLQ